MATMRRIPDWLVVLKSPTHKFRPGNLEKSVSPAMSICYNLHLPILADVNEYSPAPF